MGKFQICGHHRILSSTLHRWTEHSLPWQHFNSWHGVVFDQGAGDDEEVEEAGGLVGMLEVRLAELSKGNNDHALKKHDKYTELEQKIWDSQHPRKKLEQVNTHTHTLMHIRCSYAPSEFSYKGRNQSSRPGRA